MKITISLKAFLVGSINPQLAKIITKLPLNRLALSTIICQFFFLIMNNVSIESVFINTSTKSLSLSLIHTKWQRWRTMVGFGWWFVVWIFGRRQQRWVTILVFGLVIGSVRQWLVLWISTMAKEIWLCNSIVMVTMRFGQRRGKNLYIMLKENNNNNIIFFIEMGKN